MHGRRLLARAIRSFLDASVSARMHTPNVGVANCPLWTSHRITIRRVSAPVSCPRWARNMKPSSLWSATEPLFSLQSSLRRSPSVTAHQHASLGWLPALGHRFHRTCPSNTNCSAASCVHACPSCLPLDAAQCCAAAIGFPAPVRCINFLYARLALYRPV